MGKVYADRFQVLEVSGQGGMGTICRAHDLQTGAQVALKILHDRQAVSTERFDQEAALLSELAHPGIVRYIAHGVTSAGEHYLAMEWLEGETLEDRLGRGPLGTLESARLGRRALETLAAAHRRGVVHRDIKPANLFLPSDDLTQVKLLDFGIARRMYESRRLTVTGSTLGTPMYMSPEQARGESRVDARADIFALGCVLFECLTGKPPFTGESPMAVLAKICLDESPDVAARCPDLPSSFPPLLRRMLAKDPAGRPGRTEELAEEFAVLCRKLQDDGYDDPARAALRARTPPPLLVSGEQRVLTVVMVSRPRSARPELEDAGERDGPPLPSAGAEESALEAARRLIEPLGARLDRLMDGSMVVTLVGRGAPTDQAVQGARAALALREILPGSVFAVSMGRAVLRAALPIGDVLDAAARLLMSEPPGTISVDETTAGLLEARFEVAGGARKRLLFEKGLKEAPRTLLGKETPCVGRDRELNALEALFEECVGEPVARVALVSAPAGGGKSRVRFELLQRLQARGEPFVYLVGQGDAMRAGAPFALLGPALRAAAGLGDRDPPALARDRLATYVGKRLSADHDRAPLVAAFLGEICGVPFPDHDLPALGAARQDPRLMADQMLGAWLAWMEAECTKHPVVLVLEDLHWGDVPSVQFVDAALRTLADRPLLVLAWARPEVDQVFPDLWESRSPVRLALPPLTSKACQRLARHVLGPLGEEKAAWLVERADGNPFVFEELLRAVASGVEVGDGVLLPHTVLGMVQARFDAFGPDARRVLSAASVFGQTFRRAAVAALLEGEGVEDLGAWLEILTGREVIYPRQANDDDTFIFRHALLRDAAYDLLPEHDRQAAHLHAGIFLEAAGEREAIVLVEHFERGGDRVRAAHWCRFAASQALEANDLAAAVARALRGVDCGAEGSTLGHLRLIEAQARFWRGEYAAAETTARQALLLVEGASRLLAAAELVAALGQQARYDEVERLLSDMLAAPPPVHDRHPFIACALRAADFLLAAGRYQVSEQTLTQVESLGGHDLPPTLTARARELRAKLACHAGDQATGVAGFEAALRAFEAAGDERSACELLHNVGVTLGELGVLEQAEEHLRRALATAERLDLQYVIAGVLMNLALLLTHQARLYEARTCAERALNLARKQGDRRFEGAALLSLAMIAHSDLDSARAKTLAGEAVEALQQVPPALPLALSVLSRALLGSGRVAEALDNARSANVLLEALGRVEDGEASVRLVYAEALAAAGRWEEARQVLDRAVNRLEERAAAISKPEWRASFLSRLPDHARTVALRAEWRMGA
jgi:eukaryotic-like serine/threonine-protein kinase